MQPEDPLLDAPLNRSARLAFRIAHRMLRAYWFVRRPRTQGALVALWFRGELLIVKNSYRKQYTLPGGYVHPSETPEEGAARELYEETDIQLDSRDLEMVYADTHDFEFRQDYVCICEGEVQARPQIKIDCREVVWADFRAPSDILKMPIVPHLREYLAARSS